jgi:hypothetical protein
MILATSMTWPEAFASVIGVICIYLFLCVLVTDKWPWGRK